MAEEEKNEKAPETKAKKPKNKKRRRIVVCVIVAVIVVAGIGGWSWHNTPNFCGTLCHDTMNEHLANYEGTDASGGAGQAHVHQASGVGCLDCHKADIETQLSELNTQITANPGNVGLSSRYYVDNQTCLDCHGGSYEELQKQTESLGDYNPHNNPHNQMNCNECHKGHSAQINTCGECHANGGQQMVG